MYVKSLISSEQAPLKCYLLPAFREKKIALKEWEFASENHNILMWKQNWLPVLAVLTNSSYNETVIISQS